MKQQLQGAAGCSGEVVVLRAHPPRILGVTLSGIGNLRLPPHDSC